MVFFARTGKRTDSKKRTRGADLVAYLNRCSVLEESFTQQMTRIFYPLRRKRTNVELLLKRKIIKDAVIFNINELGFHCVFPILKQFSKQGTEYSVCYELIFSMKYHIR